MTILRLKSLSRGWGKAKVFTHFKVLNTEHVQVLSALDSHSLYQVEEVYIEEC